MIFLVPVLLFIIWLTVVHGEKELSDSFPERSEFCYMDQSRTDFIDLWF